MGRVEAGRPKVAPHFTPAKRTAHGKAARVEAVILMYALTGIRVILRDHFHDGPRPAVSPHHLPSVVRNDTRLDHRFRESANDRRENRGNDRSSNYCHDPSAKIALKHVFEQRHFSLPIGGHARRRGGAG